MPKEKGILLQLVKLMRLIRQLMVIVWLKIAGLQLDNIPKILKVQNIGGVERKLFLIHLAVVIPSVLFWKIQQAILLPRGTEQTLLQLAMGNFFA